MWLISILKALLTPVIACITVYIAYRQWKDNHLRLKMENYERCLRVYQEVVKMLQRINRDFAPEWNELLVFSAATAEAPFLFHEEIPTYIDEMFKRGNELRVANLIYRAGTEAPPRNIDEYQEALQNMHAQTRWFIDQIPIAKDKFKVYLHIASSNPTLSRLTLGLL
jgi:hypothetical protein